MCRFILAQGSFDAGLVFEAAVSMSIGLTADHDGPSDSILTAGGRLRSGTGAGG